MQKMDIKKEKYNLHIDIKENEIDKIYTSLPKIIRLYSKKYKIIFTYRGKSLTSSEVISLNNQKLTDIFEVVSALNEKNLEIRYNYIYDCLCKKLDKENDKNYCKFIDNICIKDAKQNCTHTNGCCNGKNRGTCKYLVNNRCSINCIACKLFTCKYLQKQGIIHKLDNYVLSSFFTARQKQLLYSSFFIPKEEIVSKLLKCKPFSI